MSVIDVVAISGSPSRTSRSRALLERAVATLESDGVRARVVDLADLPAPALLARERAAEVDAALGAAAGAQLVIASTPVYRATYSGLLKLFFDLLPRDALAAAVALPIATGASPEHALVIAHGLGPLFASVGATIAPGVYATDSHFHNGAPEDRLLERVDVAARDALALARARTLRPRGAPTSPQPSLR